MGRDVGGRVEENVQKERRKAGVMKTEKHLLTCDLCSSEMPIVVIRHFQQ